MIRFRVDGYADIRRQVPHDFVFTLGLVFYLGPSAQVACAELNS